MINVSVEYQVKLERIYALEDKNLTIDNHEYVMFFGKSGAGKTTALNVIAGFIKPTQGKILVDNKDISSFSEQEICKYRNQTIGYIAQSYNLIYPFTVLENVMTPLLIQGISKKAAKEKAYQCLSNVSMEQRANHRPDELSGGEQQRVAIARALVNDPMYILADEPTGNLDAKNEAQILDIFDRIHENGKTIVMVTHNREIAERADRVILF